LLPQFLALALIASFLQVNQITNPDMASAILYNPFIANFNNSTPGTFIVVSGVTSISITMRGGAGGTGGADSKAGGNPRNVNVVTQNLTVTPEETPNNGVGGLGNFGVLGNYSGGNGAIAGPWGCSGDGAGGGAVTNYEISGTVICVITRVQLVKATLDTCKIRAIKVQDGYHDVQCSPSAVFALNE
jgi:hypothetical protein